MVHAIVLSVNECQMIEGYNLTVWLYLGADRREEFLWHHVLRVVQLPLEGCQVPPATRKMFILFKQGKSLVLNGQLAELGIAELAIPIIVQNIEDTFDLLGRDLHAEVLGGQEEVPEGNQVDRGVRDRGLHVELLEVWLRRVLGEVHVGILRTEEPLLNLLSQYVNQRVE